MKYILLLILLFNFCFFTFGQSFNKSELQNVKMKYEDDLLQKRRGYQSSNKKYADSIVFNDGEKGILQYVENDIPYYIKSHNQQARSTTGITYVQSEDGLGLSLFGNGLTVGVWDGGQVKKSHKEFRDGRVINKEGADFSNHATHVSGTILASGVNVNSKGMAPFANAIAYTFNDDISSIATEATKGLLISNHSYGFILGWNYNSSEQKWEWFGGDNDVDLRFGHYSQKSRAIDEIAYNAPYYTSVWSAGNDRSDVGDGTKAADGPYKIIGPNGVSKNVITVGAITGFSEYKDASSAVMSSFSSWGPTADGRIKPDIVADGVGVFSVGSSNDSAYSTLSGTSMAAPNVTGSLLLVQEYYKSITDTFMTSASLKALAIHTARRTGKNIGPDAKFGWGVLNTVDIINLLKSRNDEDSIMLEGTLQSDEVQVFEIFSDGITPITATMVWTDPPGENGSPGNTEKMLVNDLDLLIYDDGNTQYNSWKLNPSNFDESIATGNHVDNVEKINLTQPKSRRYYVEISHSGELQGGKQNFSLIITGNKKSLGDSDIYMVGLKDTLQSNLQWAQNSGDDPLNEKDIAGHTLIFDENSPIEENKVFYLNDNLEIENLINHSQNNFSIDLDGHSLTVNGEIISPNNKINFINGIVIIDRPVSNESDKFPLNIEGSDDFKLIFRNGSYTLSNDISVGSLEIESADLVISGLDINLKNLDVRNTANIQLNNSKISINGELNLDLNNSDFTRNSWFLNNSSIISNNNELILSDTLYFSGDNYVSTSFDVSKIVIEGELSADQNINCKFLEIKSNSTILFNNPISLNIAKSFLLLAEENKEIVFQGTSGIAQVNLQFRSKLCLDFLNLTNIEVTGESIINVGTNSILDNTLNVSQTNCDDILFVNFLVEDGCTDQVVKIIDQSSGNNINSYEWIVTGGYIFNNEIPNEPEVVFNSDAEIHRLELKLSSELEEESFAMDVSLAKNELRPINIISNSSGLVANVEGDQYIWYKNGTIIEDLTGRTIPEQNTAGIYQVAYFRNDSSCNSRLSSPFEVNILSTNKDILRNVNVYPNPVETKVFIENLEKDDRIHLYDHLGRTIITEDVPLNKIRILDVSGFESGIYMLKIIRNKQFKYHKILKK